MDPKLQQSAFYAVLALGVVAADGHVPDQGIPFGIFRIEFLDPANDRTNDLSVMPLFVRASGIAHHLRT